MSVNFNTNYQVVPQKQKMSAGKKVAIGAGVTLGAAAVAATTLAAVKGKVDIKDIKTILPKLNEGFKTLGKEFVDKNVEIGKFIAKKAKTAGKFVAEKAQNAWGAIKEFASNIANKFAKKEEIITGTAEI